MDSTFDSHFALGPMRIVTIVMLASVAFLARIGAAAEPGKSANGAMFFESHIRPLLIENCLNCHSTQKKKGGLSLESRASAMKGGKHGLVLTPGDPSQSKLLKAVAYQDESLQMPPETRLSEGQVKILTEWIQAGAFWPDSAILKPAVGGKRRVIGREDHDYWAYQPPKDQPIPSVKDARWTINPIDRFVLAKLEAEGLTPAPIASRAEYIRRATFDLIGLPPTPEEVKAFESDTAPDAYERLIDRLLSSPLYGQRWARHWMDVIRYAESDGFSDDAYRPGAWPFRDYLVRSFNDDKPYDQFVREQLAGDELSPGDVNAMIPTGYMRAGMYEFNQRDVPRQWTQMLTDVTEVTADAFLGLSMGCCQCHDHKFDPLLRTDYYRFQAFFTPMLPRNDILLASQAEQEAYKKSLAEWEEKTASIRVKLDAIEKKSIEAAIKDVISKFPPDMKAILDKPADQRTPLEEQLAQLALRQAHDPAANRPKIPPTQKVEHDALLKELAKFDSIKPKPLITGMLMTDVGSAAPPTFVPGDSKHAQEPGFPVIFDHLPISKPHIVPTKTSTGRRAALAEWITQPQHPLTGRVLVNRLWQYHFGRGIVASSGDFGHLGSLPSHPELIDYLARHFVDGGWKLKPIHRLIMLSQTYRQTSGRPAPEVAKLKDPDNLWLWRMNCCRLDADQIHDGMLALSGELREFSAGPGAELTDPVRAVFLKHMRNKVDALMEVFDAPESFSSVAIRNQTTTAAQSLTMINGAWTLSRAKAMASRVQKEADSADWSAWVDRAYRLAYARAPRAREMQSALDFLAHSDKPENGLADLCHILLNSSEFLYVE